MKYANIVLLHIYHNFCNGVRYMRLGNNRWHTNDYMFGRLYGEHEKFIESWYTNIKYIT